MFVKRIRAVSVETFDVNRRRRDCFKNFKSGLLFRRMITSKNVPTQTNKANLKTAWKYTRGA